MQGRFSSLYRVGTIAIEWHLLWRPLRIGSQKIPAHKIVLAARFPYFMRMFTRRSSKKNIKVIELKRVDGDAISSLIKFAYTGELAVAVNNVQSLYVAADLFKLEMVKIL